MSTTVPDEFVCGVCFSTVSIASSISCLSEDKHPFCTECIKNYVTDGFNADVNGLICMAPECSNVFPMDAIKEILPADHYNGLEKRIADVNIAKAGIRNLKSCRYCDKVYDVDAGVSSFVCCGKTQCTVCGDYFGENHLKNVCIGRFPTLDDRLSAAVVRRCPCCRLQIQKSDGCNEMTCLSCKTKFCYLCRSAIGVEDHFCRCRSSKGSSRLKESDGPCRCGRECLQFGNAEEYDARMTAIRDEYAGKRIERPIGTTAYADVIIDDDDVVWLPSPVRREGDAVPGRDVIVIDEAADNRRIAPCHILPRRRFRQPPYADRHEAERERERARRSPFVQEILITHRPVSAYDAEAVREIYDLLRLPLPRNQNLFREFSASVSRIWNVRLERYFNIPNDYINERRRYMIRDSRNGLPIFLFERIRIV